jgi:hypothetical protein
MSRRIGGRSLRLLSVVAVLVFSPASRAQTANQENKGINSGDYNIQGTVDVGYRQDWIGGNLNTYDTFVDLGTGVRLLNYTMNMRSLDHRGIFFDNLAFSNFGYGGDPDNVSRLRIEKNKWYDFSLVFRRHKNFWDYNLLANPLNPAPLAITNPVSSSPAAFPGIAINTSPAALYLVRRMQDYELTLLPESRVRFRLGYSRDVNEGPSLNSFHGTTDILLNQNFEVTTNAYHVGLDFRILPKTTISYDQFLDYNKLDTSYTLANTPFIASGPSGTLPVDLGLNWYYPPTSTTAPCGATLAAAPFPGGYPGFASPTCKEYQAYSRTAPARNFMPTERLSFQSAYFQRLEMSGSASYNSSNNVISNLSDIASEWTNPSASAGQIREAIVSGPANARQISVHANWSAIFSLTQRTRLVDSLNYDNWRTSGVFNQISTNLFATLPQVTGQTGILLPIAQFAPLASGGPTFASICPAPYTAITCPQHGSASAPDIYNTFNQSFLGQKRLSNTLQLEADLAKRISARIGYLYEQRQISETPWDALYPSNMTVPNSGAVYYPGGKGGTAANKFFAARGACAFPAGSNTLPAGCTLNADGSIVYTPALTTSADSSLYCANGTNSNPAFSIQTVFVGHCVTTINEHVGLAGLTLRPTDKLRIYADFQFGYNDNSYTRTSPRQIQSYKVHASYSPKPWTTLDGAVDIHENRDNVAEVNNLEHGRTYSFSTVLARSSKLAFTIGYNYTDISLQTFICFRDTSGTMTGSGGTPGYLLYTPTNSPCPFTTASATGAGTNSSINLGTTAFYTSHQHFAYSDVMWNPVKRITADVGYAGTFVGGSTVFLNPLQPAGTLAFNYQKPFVSLRFDIYRGLSYKTTCNYYGYNSKAPITASIPVTVPITGGSAAAMYTLQPIAAPDFNGSTLMLALQYAF